MSQTLNAIKALIAAGDVLISEHGYDELAADDLTVREIIQSIDAAVVVEDYPKYPKGPCVLVLQSDARGGPVHVVWGISRGSSSPAVLITAYRPDPARWNSSFTGRKQ